MPLQARLADRFDRTMRRIETSAPVLPTLKGGRENDSLFGGAGNNRLVGGKGDDTATFAGRPIDYTFTSPTQSPHNPLSIANIEHATESTALPHSHAPALRTGRWSV